jgi:hypothetical protein
MIIMAQRLAMVAMWSGQWKMIIMALIMVPTMDPTPRICRRISSTFGLVNMLKMFIQFRFRLRSPNTRLRTQKPLPLTSTRQVAGPVHLTTHVMSLSRTLKAARLGTRSTK